MSRPNIVVILADDLGWTDLGCYGSGYYETPAIDQLAKDGLRFRRHYHCPNCAPTRACLMTGQWPTRTGIYTVGTLARGRERDRKMQVPTNVENLPLDRRTIADQLRAAGYATALFGKWHLGQEGPYHPSKRGFEEARVTEGRHFDFTVDPPLTTPPPPGTYLADWLTDQAIEFLGRQKADRPFFLYLSHFGVHSPWQAKQPQIERFMKKPGVGGHRDPTYAAMIASVDESVARIVAALESQKLAQNTVLLFVSDNGGVGGYGDLARNITDNTPLRGGKGQHYEGGLRVPLIVRWPGTTPKGRSCNTPTTHVDFFPTFLAISGAARPVQPLDGVNLIPLLRQPSLELPRALYQHLPGYLEGRDNQWRSTPVSTIIDGDWKLIEFLEEKRHELYNVRDDIGERNDLAAKLPEKAKALQAKLEAWRTQTGAAMPTFK